MYHFFDVEVANEYGVDQAILIAHFQFWINHNAANKTNYHEGKFWTYNSYRALALLFPYWSEKQVRRILNDLVDKQVLKVGNFNKKDFDKTNWYAFVNDARWVKMPSAPLGSTMCPNGQMPEQMPSAHIDQSFAPVGTSSAQLGKAIPDNTIQIGTTDNTPVKNKKKKTTKVVEPVAPPGDDPGKDQVNAAPEVPPVAPPPQSAQGDEIPFSQERGPKPKGKETLYQLMMKTYFEWMEDVVGVPPVIDKGQGQAMKNLLSYFLKVNCKRAEFEKSKNAELVITEDMINVATNASWGKLLQGLASGSVEPFLRNQTKLTQIYSNLTNIINQLKNGTGKGKQTNSQGPTVEDVHSRFEQRYNSGGAQGGKSNNQ